MPANETADPALYLPTGTARPSGQAFFRYGTGSPVVGMPWLGLSARHFTAHDLTAARHTFGLARRDEVIPNLDYAQGGLGNGTCEPGVLERW